MLVSFVQTHGKGREELYEIYSRDKRLIEFKNLFDLNIHSFHNCSDETVSKRQELNKVRNTIVKRFNDVEYTETIHQIKIYLKDIGCTHFFFSQDDTFSFDNNGVDWEELLKYITSYKENFMINLKIIPGEVNHFLKPTKKYKTFETYHLTSLDYLRGNCWPMDDSPFICSIDMLDIIYGDEYRKKQNIYYAEFWLSTNFGKIPINRFITDRKLFVNYNIHGQTIMKKDHFRKKLKERKLL